jgi:hypothetical protein
MVSPRTDHIRSSKSAWGFHNALLANLEYIRTTDYHNLCARDVSDYFTGSSGAGVSCLISLMAVTKEQTVSGSGSTTDALADNVWCYALECQAELCDMEAKSHAFWGIISNALVRHEGLIPIYVPCI